MYKLNIYSGASLLRSTLYPSCIPVVCVYRLIIFVFFNFWSVVGVVSGNIKFTTLLCREFNLLLRTSLHLSHTTDA